MKTYLYLSTAIISVSLATGGEAWAQCVSTQDCDTLGYTETSCPNGGVKCPFGSKWFCGGDSTTICKQEGFTETCTGAGQFGKGESCANLYKQCDCQSTYKYTCSGTGYSGGSGSACGGKYTTCKCSSGYEWKDGSCKIQDECASICNIGCLYYSDNTCSSSKVSGKTLLGVVIYEKSASQNGWVMTVKPVATDIAWSTEYVDIPGLNNITSESRLTDIQASCTNTDVITKYGNSSTYPAAWAAKNYKEGGKTWCLPSGGLLKNALDNSANFTKFNAAVYKIQASAGTSAATILGNVSGGYERVWSSSEFDLTNPWIFYAYTSGSFRMGYGSKGAFSYDSVRPVLAF